MVDDSYKVQFVSYSMTTNKDFCSLLSLSSCNNCHLIIHSSH